MVLYINLICFQTACYCKLGFSGDGKQCEAINVCLEVRAFDNCIKQTLLVVPNWFYVITQNITCINSNQICPYQNTSSLRTLMFKSIVYPFWITTHQFENHCIQIILLQLKTIMNNMEPLLLFCQKNGGCHRYAQCTMTGPLERNCTCSLALLETENLQRHLQRVRNTAKTQAHKWNRTLTVN